MKVLALGDEPHVEIDYEAIEIAPGEFITWDHLHGFTNNYRSITLDRFNKGVVHTEYILPDVVKQRYPALDLRFDATMMIHNNHFDAFPFYVQEPPTKTWTNFVSTFNKTRTTTKQNLLLLCYANGWFDPTYVSKCFAISHDQAQSFFDAVNRPLPQDLDKFCKLINQFELTGYGNIKADLELLVPKIHQSYLHLVTETIGDSAVPFPTEKFLFPVCAKTLWIAYAPVGYHAFIEKHIGFRKHKVIDYHFDDEADAQKRLLKIEQVIKDLASKSAAELEYIYAVNQDVLEYNFQLVKSGKFIENLKKQDQASDAICAYRCRQQANKRYRRFMDIT